MNNLALRIDINSLLEVLEIPFCNLDCLATYK